MATNGNILISLETPCIDSDVRLEGVKFHIFVDNRDGLDSHTKTLDEAIAQCANLDDGMIVAVPRSSLEMEALHNFTIREDINELLSTPDNRLPAVFLGLFDETSSNSLDPLRLKPLNGDDDFSSFYADRNAFPWKPGDHNNFAGREHCAEMFLGTNNWNDNSCTPFLFNDVLVRGVLCEAQCSVDPPTISPTESPAIDELSSLGLILPGIILLVTGLSIIALGIAIHYYQKKKTKKDFVMFLENPDNISSYKEQVV